MSGFRWTPRRDRELLDLRRDGFVFRDVANMLGCTREEAIGRAGELARAKPGSRAAAVDLTVVPRPVPPAPPAIARPAKIDLRGAPSSMELAVEKWRGA